MKRAVAAIALIFLLLGITVMDAAATDVVIVICQQNFLQVPVTAVDIVSCSKSSGVSRACPIDPAVTNCAQVLANYLSDGLVIRSIKPNSQDNGLIYTLTIN
jgi:hypothetical protein